MHNLKSVIGLVLHNVFMYTCCLILSAIFSGVHWLIYGNVTLIHFFGGAFGIYLFWLILTIRRTKRFFREWKETRNLKNWNFWCMPLVLWIMQNLWNGNRNYEWGRVYVLDTCNGSVVKQLFPSDHSDTVTCKSINSKYVPFEVRLKDVYGVYRVLMCISLK